MGLVCTSDFGVYWNRIDSTSCWKSLTHFGMNFCLSFSGPWRSSQRAVSWEEGEADRRSNEPMGQQERTRWWAAGPVGASAASPRERCDPSLCVFWPLTSVPVTWLLLNIIFFCIGATKASSLAPPPVSLSHLDPPPISVVAPPPPLATHIISTTSSMTCNLNHALELTTLN